MGGQRVEGGGVGRQSSTPQEGHDRAAAEEDQGTASVWTGLSVDALSKTLRTSPDRKAMKADFFGADDPRQAAGPLSQGARGDRMEHRQRPRTALRKGVRSSRRAITRASRRTAR
ncbi:hypothetical protein SNE510_63640 [Streptomyces sp. NE5-10]|nr:hypothetical protein SNE510_63640 [Streptomyces sp. NE5-10]